MSKNIIKNEELEQFKVNEVINRFTEVTEENVRRIADKIYRAKLPCVKSLYCDSLDCLVDLLSTECILYKVPLIFFLDGSFRMSRNDKRVTYYGSTAVQLYTHMAIENKLPLVKSVNFKYILDNIKLTVALQKTFEKMSAAKKLSGSPFESFLSNDPDFKDLLLPENKNKYLLPEKQRFIIVPKEQIYCADQFSINSNFLYCLAGDYHIVGAIGELVLEDNTKYPFKYELNPESTKLANALSESAYSKNPLQFIEIKFKRHAMKSFYSTQIAGMPRSSDDLEFDGFYEANSVKGSIDERMDTIVSKSKETAKKIEKLENFEEVKSKPIDYMD